MNSGEQKRARKPWRKKATRGILFLLGGYVLAVATGCCNPSLPVDLAMNLPSNEFHEELRVEDDEPTLVVLQHGLWRSWGSLWRLERALEKHGYEVLNRSYPSTRGTIDEHAALLEKRINAHLENRTEPLARICFVGHSMGGLVIRKYLQRPGAIQADTCIFLGTPHRGAARVDQKKDGLFFSLLMGDKAVLELSPSHPIYKSFVPLRCPTIATIIGGQGDGEGLSKAIPGDDDGTVAVLEAHLAGETSSLLLNTGHTRLSCTEEPIQRVLHFLKHRSF